jgi:hypothetical protein
MPQPIWVTAAGNLGVIPEGVYYQVNVQADAGADPVYYRLIAGSLPPGIQVSANGAVEGIPQAVIAVEGVPLEVDRDVTSTFAIRAYTTRIVNGNSVVDRISDRTFSLTVTGQNVPEFTTPPGRIGAFFDGTEIAVQIEYTDTDTTDNVQINLLSGQLPPGLVLSKTGMIAGVILPLQVALTVAKRSYPFVLEITDGKDSNIRSFEILIYSRHSMSADTIEITDDNTIITSDTVNKFSPLLLTPAGSIGVVRSDNYYSFKFEAIDFEGDDIAFITTLGAGIGFDSGNYDMSGFDRGAFGVPPGLSIDSATGWLHGYIPDQGATETSYRFGVQAYKISDPTMVSALNFYTITIIGNIDTQITWLTDPDLGIINNGAISTLSVEAVNAGGRSLQYRLVSGSDSQLPQGLSLLPTGHIVGRVSFNTFALDGGTTTFDVVKTSRLDTNPTTFDLQFNFTVNAFAAQTEQIGYSVGSFIIVDGGTNYTSQPTITISAPPVTESSIQATAGIATIVDGTITSIEVGNPGAGYTSPPTVTITGGGGSGSSVVARMEGTQSSNAISVTRRFTVTVNRAFNEPYESLYIKAMPPLQDRALLSQLLQNQDIIPSSALYRADDPNFGIASSVKYVHAYGLTSATVASYVNAMDINHYWKFLTLGTIKTARALDANGNVQYEVIYSEIIDDLVNSAGQSVGKSVTLPYPVATSDSTEIDVVYPNSLINMRNQIIDSVGQISPALPLWMTSKQSDESVLGFVPAWVIAYVKPGQSGKIKYDIQQKLGFELNIIDYKVDRYELDRSQTHNWDPVTDNWIPHPPTSTTFDQDQTTFDHRSTAFNAPADRWTGTDVFDKYLVFPKTNILG